MKPSIFFQALSLSIAISTAAFAADEYNLGNGLTLGGNQLGMHGVDPVSVIESTAPTKGNIVHTSTYDSV